MISFQPTCTSPASSPIFVNAADVRGTLDIIWPYLTVLLLCTWNIQHLNVPAQCRKPSTRTWMYYQLYSFWRKSTWMIITMIAPEIIFGKAINDLASAIYNKNNLERLIEEDGVDWGLSHSYFANMGGFIIQFPPTEEHPSTAPTHFGSDTETSSHVEPGPNATEGEHSSSRTPNTNKRTCSTDLAPSKDTQKLRVWLRARERGPWAMKHFRYINTTYRAFLGDVAWAPNRVNTCLANEAHKTVICDERYGLDPMIKFHDSLKVLQGNIWVLDANQLLYARDRGIVSRLPALAQEDLDDKNKGDSVVKFLALFQIFWLILQLTVRKSRDLAVSQLEISTLAYAVSSLVTYGISWKKPQDARCPVAGTATRYPSLEEMCHLAGTGPQVYGPIRSGWWTPNHSFHYAGPKLGCMSAFVLGSCIGNTIFSALHMLAWNFQFPNTTERHFWRISTILTIAIPWVSFLVNAFIYGSLRRLRLFEKDFMWWSYVSIFGSAYVLARLFMMVETFRTLYYLPPNAYRATWSADVPHFG